MAFKIRLFVSERDRVFTLFQFVVNSLQELCQITVVGDL